LASKLSLVPGTTYTYSGSDGSYSLLLGSINSVNNNLIVSGSSYMGDTLADQVQVTGSFKARSMTGSIGTVDGSTAFLTQGSGATVSYNAASGQWTIGASGGGTPAGFVNQIQMANAGASAMSASSGLWFTSNGNNLYVSGGVYTSGNSTLGQNSSNKTTITGSLLSRNITGSISSVDGSTPFLAQSGNATVSFNSATGQWTIGASGGGGTPGGASNQVQLADSAGTAFSGSGGLWFTSNGNNLYVSGTITATNFQLKGNEIKSSAGAVAIQTTGSNVAVSGNLIVSGTSLLGNDSSDLTAVTGSFMARNMTGSIGTVDGSTAFLAQSGNATVSYNATNGQWTIGATGGGTPGGAGNQIQLANAAGSAFSGSGGLWYTSNGNNLYLSGALVIGSANTIDIPSTKDINLFPTLGNNTLTIGQVNFSKLIVGAQMGVYNGVNISGNDIQSSSGAVAIRLSSADTEHRGRTYFNGDLIPSTGFTSVNVLNTIATTVSFAGTATTLNIGGASAAQTVTIGGGSTGASTYNIGTGTSTSGNDKTVNIGTGNASGSKTVINLGTAQGGKTTVSGSFEYNGDFYASDIQVVSSNVGVSSTARYIRFTATADLALPALSESIHGRVLTISNMIFAGGTGTIKPDGTENVIVLGTSGLGSVTLPTQRQWVELVAKFVAGGNDNGWYAVCGGLVPTLD